MYVAYLGTQTGKNNPVYCKLNCGFSDEDTRHPSTTKLHIFIYFIFYRISDTNTKPVFILWQRDLKTLELVKYFYILYWSVKYSANFKIVIIPVISSYSISCPDSFFYSKYRIFVETKAEFSLGYKQKLYLCIIYFLFLG